MNDHARSRRLRRLSFVPRWTVIPTIRKQSVAEHSYHVAHIALWVSRMHKTLASGDRDFEILFFAIIHDETEALTGDIPSPSAHTHMPNKKQFDVEHALGASTASDEVEQVLKVADVLEALLFLWEEKKMGNTMEFIEADVTKNLYRALEGFPWIGANDHALILGKFKNVFDPGLDPIQEGV